MTAEEYIEKNTIKGDNAIREWNQYSDKYEDIVEYTPWLTPDQARKAVEIAMEEIIDKTLVFLKDKLYESGYVGIMDLCDEYIKTMKDE